MYCGGLTLQSRHTVLEAKRLYNVFLDKYISCLRSYCSAMVDLGRGMYVHEVRELERDIARKSSNDKFLIFNNNKGKYKPQMLSHFKPVQRGQQRLEAGNRRGEAAAGVMALAKLRESVEIIRNVKSTDVNFDFASKSSVEKNGRKE